MKKKFTYVIVILSLIMTIFTIPTFAAADTSNDSFLNSKDISCGSSYSGELSDSSTVDYYKFTINESGMVNVKVTTTMARTYYRIYDSNNVQVWGERLSNGADVNVHLVTGTYYFYVGRYDSNGTYNFRLNFTSATESKKESVNDLQNSLATAPEIDLDTSYKGQLASNDNSDYYKFVLSESGRINMKVTTTMARTYYRIYDSNNVQVWGDRLSNGADVNIDLTSGVYYFYVQVYDNTGTYDFNLSFTSALESKAESLDELYNSLDRAPSIELNTDYKGQLAANDSVDYYKFSLSESGRINMKVTTTMARTYYRIYDSSNVQVWGDRLSNGADVNIDLTVGTYYFYMQVYDNTGDYSFNLSYSSATENFKESVNENRNTLNSAPTIQLNKSYNGQLAANDNLDYYKFTLDSKTKVILNVRTSMARTYYRIYNSSNSQVWGDRYSNGINDAVIELDAGTYYFYAQVYDSTGNYTFSLSQEHTCSGSWVNISDPTCTEQGSKEQICDICGKSIEVQVVPANGHISENWDVARAASCHSDGLRHGLCLICNEHVTESIPQLTHIYRDWETVSGNKLIPPIVREKQCSLCGEVEQVKDWSFVWIPIVCGVVAIFAIVGIINYVRILKKGKTK